MRQSHFYASNAMSLSAKYEHEHESKKYTECIPLETVHVKNSLILVLFVADIGR